MPDIGVTPATHELPAESGRRRGWVLATLCLGVLVAQVDTSVVNLAMQPIRASFGASVGALQWVLDGYNLAYAILLLSGGLIADLTGRRRVFRAGAAVIGAASVACAFAPGIGVLIAARIAAGVGAAMLLPASLAIVRVVWPEPRARRHALGVWASCNGLAFVIGPTLGGFLIERFGWPSVFLVAVPLVLAAFVMAGLVVPESADPADRRLDLAGQVLGAVALGGFVLAGIDGHQGGSAWVASLALAVVALALFLRVEHRAGAAAMVPLALFRQPPFCGAVAATAAMTFGIYGMIFLVPLLWQATGLLRPQGAGLALLPCALVFFLVSQRSGHLANRFGVRVMVAGGAAMIGCGLIVLACTEGGRPLPMAEIGLALTGIGMGLTTGPVMSVAVGAVEATRSGTASALINVARMTGATLGVALLGAAFAWGGGGVAGLRVAMLAGATVQLLGAAVAWVTVRG
ncbi:MAG TPA: MFS transporter [Acetobacteraceae bacterium]|nr:MFS transporter [Acetobacteraceae bacterium]